MRQFLRCPKTPASGKQCEFFQWLEDTKAQEYEKMYDLRASMGKSPKPKQSKTRSGSPSDSESSSTSNDDMPTGLSPAGSPAGSPQQRGSKKNNKCAHEWSRRGTNPYAKVKTCKLCGLQEVFTYKDQVTVQRWVDLDAPKPKKSKDKKKAPLRSVSP